MAEPVPLPARLLLVRHGEPRQHSGRIFLGQTDVPLSARGREQAREAAAELAWLGVRTNRVYTSDLRRAAETAAIIVANIATNTATGRNADSTIARGAGVTPAADHADAVTLIPVPAWRELSLGEWDGRLIADIQRDFPAAYAARGADPLHYRVAGGENFIDLRRRVTREFARVIREEFSPALRAGGPADLVLVTHLGVIHMLLADLAQPPLTDAEILRLPRYPTGSVIARPLAC